MDIQQLTVALTSALQACGQKISHIPYDHRSLEPLGKFCYGKNHCSLCHVHVASHKLLPIARHVE